MLKNIRVTLLALGLIGCGFIKQQKSNSVNLKIEELKIPLPSMSYVTKPDYQTNPINPNSKMIGYLIDGYKPTNNQFKKMTHISISFLRAVNSSGDIRMTQGWEKLEEVISEAHYNNVKAIISFGGGEYKVTSELMGIRKNRQNLIKNIIVFIKKYNLDGLDCDWEPSWLDDRVEMEVVNNALTDYYLIFIQEFRKALDNEFGKGNKTFSAAIMNGNSVWYSSEKQIAHFPKNGWWHYLDWVALMNYDNDLGSKHATFESVFGSKGSVSYWTNFGVPQSKIVVGVPFYGRASWGEEWLFYKDIVEMNPLIADSINYIVHKKNNFNKKVYGYNGTKIVTKKVAEAKRLNLAGLMFWQLAGDLPVDNEKSLLRAMSKEFKK